MDPRRRLPFATIVTRDAYERVSNLDRPGVFRLNIGVGRETYRSMFGDLPHASPDGSVLDTGMTIQRSIGSSRTQSMPRWDGSAFSIRVRRPLKPSNRCLMRLTISHAIATAVVPAATHNPLAHCVDGGPLSFDRHRLTVRAGAHALRDRQRNDQSTGLHAAGTKR
jgi:Family of unknown function (DUF6194)